MSVLFFLMLFTLGIDSIFAFVETIVAFIDGAAHMFKKEHYLRRMATMWVISILWSPFAYIMSILAEIYTSCSVSCFIGLSPVWLYSWRQSLMLLGFFYLYDDCDWLLLQHHWWVLLRCQPFYICMSSLSLQFCISSLVCIDTGLLLSCFTVMLAICFDFKYKRILDTMLGTGHPISKWYATPTFFFFAPIGSLFLAM